MRKAVSMAGSSTLQTRRVWDPFQELGRLQEEMGRLLAPAATEPSPAASPAAGVSAAGDLRLFTYPLLIDEGRLSERADELKAALQEPAFVEVHPRDAQTAGVADGGRVVVSTDAGRAELDARVTEHVAPGAVFVPCNQPGLAANTLLSGELVTGVTLEAVASAAPGDAEPEPVAVGGEAP